MRSDVEEAIRQAAFSAGISAPLLRAIVQVESGGNPKAYRFEPAFYRRYIAGKARFASIPWAAEPRRISASYGLGQLMYTTALDLGLPASTPPEALYSIPLNLQFAAKLVRKLWRKYGNVRDVAAAYNSGRPFARAPVFTRLTHVPKVLKALGVSDALPLPAGAIAGLPVAAVVVTIAALGVLLLSGGRNGQGSG